MPSCYENVERNSARQHDGSHDCDGSELKAEDKRFPAGLEQIHKSDRKGHDT